MTEPLKFNHVKFFDLYRDAYGSLTQPKVDGLESLLTSVEGDADIEDVRWAAYMLATVKHECADKWQPIEEYGKGAGHSYGQPKRVTGSDGHIYTNKYYGRGYVQLTWDYNYKKMGEALGMGDALLMHPEQVLEPDIAYNIMSFGMLNGSFTGKKLADYVNGSGCNYKNARRIINGLDQWERIQGYAEKLEDCLTKSQVANAASATP